MTMIYPEGVSTLANFKLLWVPAIADTDAPSLAELTGAGALDITCAIYGDTWQPSQTPNRAAAPRRACETTQRDRLTSVTQSLPDLVHATSPQAAAASDGKKVQETLTPGLEGYFVAAYGIPSRDALAIGDHVWIYPVRLGPQLDQNPADDGAEYNVIQPVDLTGEIVRDKVLVA